MNEFTTQLAGLEPGPSGQPSNATRALIQAVRAVNQAGIFGENKEARLYLDIRAARAVLLIVDRETGAVLRQLTTEHAFRLARRLAVNRCQNVDAAASQGIDAGAGELAAR